MRTSLLRRSSVRAAGALAGAAACAVALLAPAGPAPAPESSPVGEPALDFDRDIRPILSRTCWSCHGPNGDRREAGLRLDRREDALRLLESGNIAVVPGNLEESQLVVRVTARDDDARMPPKDSGKKLTRAQIDLLKRWVAEGAPWKPHWAYVKPVRPEVPGLRSNVQGPTSEVRGQPSTLDVGPRTSDSAPGWARNPIDRFILARLEASGLRPSPPADRRTLLRRVTFDLTGLPPTPQEAAAFETDPSSDAYEKVVERLLASPRYGERWGRYWLDVARYADSKDYVFADREEQRYPFAWTYRDWVIRAFNEDLPYDRFLQEQIAADLLEPRDDPRRLAALGFYTTGPRFINNPHDIIDDRIDVTMRGLLGTTATCARCHDHKFDPIPTKDYYALYGVFFNCMAEKQVPMSPDPPGTDAYLAYRARLRKTERFLETWLEMSRAPEWARVSHPVARALLAGMAELPLARVPEPTRAVWLYRGRLAAIERDAADYLAARRAELVASLRARVGDYLLAVLDAERQPGEETYQVLAPGELNPAVTRRWQAYLKASREGGHDPVWAAWHAFAAIPQKEFAAKAPAVAESLLADADPAKTVHPMARIAVAGKPPVSMRDVAARYGDLFAGVENSWQAFLRAHPGATALPDPAIERLRQALYAPGSPTNLPEGPVHEVEAFFQESIRLKIAHFPRDKDRLHLATPEAPPYAVVLVESDKPHDARILQRGNPNNPGEEVPRHFLSALAGENAPPFREGSGRLELARAVASPDNPLTARVMVNRIWMHHFGAGLVRTPGDFGSQGEPPTHPELLDWLAVTFVERGWSVKAMHRLLVGSATYRQASDDRAREAGEDPENRLLWKMNRRRLEFEPMRDAILAVAGTLDETPGGPPVDMLSPPFTTRRTVYGFIDRLNLPGLLRTFDVPNPEVTCPQRYRTTVPPQSLFLMNSPFVLEQARRMVGGKAFQALPSDEARIGDLYRRAFARPATPDEIAMGLAFIRSVPGGPAVVAMAPSAWKYGWGSYDEAAHRVAAFAPLPHWTGTTWQGGPAQPDPKIGWVMLTAGGGHPGHDLLHCAVRRWTSPVDGEVECSGLLTHESKEGDGVRARIVSSRSGELGVWTAQASQAETVVRRVEVREGDTLDFVVDSRTEETCDSFGWSSVVRTAVSAGAGSRDWDAARDFRGPPGDEPARLTAWEQFAQALMMTNEFVFVD